jgi:hypothetical protein
VIVNSRVVIDDGKHTGALPGKILYGPGHRVTAAATTKTEH